ncbi:acyl carrier protein [Streptomyces sp. NPDC097595]|uniref:acyl carrier protein n=1 Tax=unclassified Streptomyces TaxID=2593676 RepID=UPI001368641B|nr:acyl carrier protein [Streptomyces sp. SID2563]MYW07188.1 acyl carrier protein [Streptomyces sp. SID2563]
MDTTCNITDLPRFLTHVCEELGLDLTPQEAAADFDTLLDWDSVHLLRLVMLAERATGRPVPVARVLQARNLAEVHRLVVAP